MLTHKNLLTVPEVSCHSLQEVEGGYVIRYLIRNPEEVEWRAVKVFRPDCRRCGGRENDREERSWQTPNHSRR